MKPHIFQTPKEHLDAVTASKSEYERKKKSLSYEEKLKIVVKLQEKAHFMGKTKIKPWPMGD